MASNDARTDASWTLKRINLLIRILLTLMMMMMTRFYLKWFVVVVVYYQKYSTRFLQNVSSKFTLTSVV